MEDNTDITGQGGEGGMSLLYTVAFDPPGAGGMRQMVKMLGGSVVRTGFSGDMVIFRNAPAPVFMIGRQGLGEEYVETPDMEPRKLAEYAREWKAHAAAVIDGGSYEWIVFLDADCLCLRNIDHLLADRDCDILYQLETGGTVKQQTSKISTGTWAVRGGCYRQVMEKWLTLREEEPVPETGSRDQRAWNRLIFDAAQEGWRAEPFEAHEVQFPLGGDKDWRLYKDAAIVHCTGGTVPEKIQFMFGLYMQRFYHDASSTLLNVLEM
ncbi:MAG TPA: hypothetical protein VG796_27265 [Verrucomicrobiales bacterium]|jgi:hypothetical protein|nr:hypothetical protein [Verrucomicrobiales bacterium]